MGHLEQRAGLAGKAAIVVGGAGGLGRACVDDLAAAGVAVLVADRNPDFLRATDEHAAANGTSVVTFEADARDDDAMHELFALADRELGRLDVLLNVVGGTFHQPFEQSNPRGWDAVIRANFTWLLTTTQLAIPRMRAAGGGSIVNFTSIEAHRAAPNYAVYSGMKAAVTNYTRTLALELAPDAIRVNCIAADITPTEGLGDMLFGDLTDEQRTIVQQMAIPMGRVGTYEDVGGCALFLASDLSRYVTGTTLHPDGGTFASSGWFNWPGRGYSNMPPTEVVALYSDDRSGGH
jgi:NAD(P)-dependent dehydrogenase (short-subunit alcohol dehydrogenase family)